MQSNYFFHSSNNLSLLHAICERLWLQSIMEFFRVFFFIFLKYFSQYITLESRKSPWFLSQIPWRFFVANCPPKINFIIQRIFYLSQNFQEMAVLIMVFILSDYYLNLCGLYYHQSILRLYFTKYLWNWPQTISQR